MADDEQIDGTVGEIVSRGYRSSALLARLTTALAKAQAVIEGASKDKTNPHFKSDYADLASIWAACRQPLSENGLAVIQVPSADANKVTVETILAHSSGEWISGALTMTAQQNTPQAIGSCITYARRYALSAMVGVAPEDDDGNAASDKKNKSAPAYSVEAPATSPVVLPAGTVRITNVTAKQYGGDIDIVDEHGECRAYPVPDGRTVAVCEQFAQADEPVPVILEIVKGVRDGKLKVKSVKRWTPPVDAAVAPLLVADDIHF